MNGVNAVRWNVACCLHAAIGINVNVRSCLSNMFNCFLDVQQYHTIMLVLNPMMICIVNDLIPLDKLQPCVIKSWVLMWWFQRHVHFAFHQISAFFLSSTMSSSAAAQPICDDRVYVRMITCVIKCRRWYILHSFHQWDDPPLRLNSVWNCLSTRNMHRMS